MVRRQRHRAISARRAAGATDRLAPTRPTKTKMHQRDVNITRTHQLSTHARCRLTDCARFNGSTDMTPTLNFRQQQRFARQWHWAPASATHTQHETDDVRKHWRGAVRVAPQAARGKTITRRRRASYALTDTTPAVVNGEATSATNAAVSNDLRPAYAHTRSIKSRPIFSAQRNRPTKLDRFLSADFLSAHVYTQQT